MENIVFEATALRLRSGTVNRSAFLGVVWWAGEEPRAAPLPPTKPHHKLILQRSLSEAEGPLNYNIKVFYQLIKNFFIII